MRKSPLKSRLSALMCTDLDGIQAPEAVSLRRPEETLTFRACGWSRYIGSILVFGLSAAVACFCNLWPFEVGAPPSAWMRLQQGGWVALLFAVVGLGGFRYAWGYSVCLNANGVTVFNGFWHHCILWEQIASWEMQAHSVHETANSTDLCLLDRFGCPLTKLDLRLLARSRSTLIANIAAALKDRTVPPTRFDRH